MQAVSVIAPALAPLAIKLIDKYIFDEDGRRGVPKIIEVPAPPQFICCCGRATHGNETVTCSTCGPTKSSCYRSSRLHVPTKSTVRSSSTSDAYEKHKPKSSNSRMRTLSDSTMGSSRNANSRYCQEDTLGVLARNLRQEISNRRSQEKLSPRCHSKSATAERSASEMQIHFASSSSCGPKKSCSKSVSGSTQGSSRKHYPHMSENCKILKKF